MLTTRTLSRNAGLSLAALLVAALHVAPAEAARIREFDIGKEAYAITVDPDGFVHYIQSDYVNEFYDGPAGTSALVQGAVYIQNAVSGPTCLWLLDAGGNQIIRYPHVSGAVKAFPVPTANAGLFGAAIGADGNLYFTEFSANKIGRLTPAGVFTEWPIPTPGSGALAMTAAMDGRVYFTEKFGNKLGRIGTSGVIEEFPLKTPGAEPAGVASEGRTVVVVENKANKLGYFNIYTSLFDEYPLPSPNADAWGVAVAYDRFFVTERGVNKIASLENGIWHEIDIPTPSSNSAEIAIDRRGQALFIEHASKKIGLVELTVPGDVNADGKVDVGDVFYLINFLFAGGSSPK